MALIANIFSSVGRGAIVEYCAKHRFPVVSFLSFLLIFFSFFVGGKKRKYLSERFSPTMEKLLFFSFSTKARILDQRYSELISRLISAASSITAI